MIIQNFHPTIGGAEKQALELSRGLAKRGHHVSVLTPGLPGLPTREFIDNVEIHRLGFCGTSPLRFPLFAFFSVFFLLKNQHRFNVYHVHLASSHALVPAILGRILMKKVVVKLSGGKEIGELALSRKSVAGRLKLSVLKWARVHLVTVNQDQVEEIKLSGLSSLPVTMIPNGVNSDNYTPSSPDQKKQLRSELAWTGRVFLFVGRFAKDKLRPDIFGNLLQAWEQAFGQSSDKNFYLFGDGPLTSRYQVMVREMNLDKNIHLSASQTDVTSLYQAADVFVLPSITEGLSNALLEAMACGLPVVASRVSGIADIFSEANQALLFDPEKPEEMAEAFKRIDKEAEILDVLGRRSMEIVKRFSMVKTIELYEGLYSEKA